MDIFISILSLLAFVLLTASTGLFVAIEFAMTGLERSTIDAHVKQRGDATARAIARDHANLSFVLSGAQLGITVTTLAAGFLAEPVLGKFFTPALEAVGLSASASTTVALILALVIATFLSMVFGELVPKNMAITDPLATARVVVPPVHWFNTAMKPFINLLNTSANWIVRKMGIEPADELASARSSQELGAMVRSSAEAGGLDAETAAVIDRSLRFGETTAEEVMTPRSTIDSLDAEDTVVDLIALARETGRSRFPVRRGDLDDTLGVVHIKDAFSVPPDERATTQLATLARRVPIVPGTLDGDSVLNRVRSAGSQVVLVADEYGGTMGLVTIEDLVEEILGEVYDEYDDRESEKDFVRYGTSWEVSGLVRLDELEERLAYTAPDGPYETLGGLIMATLGRIPKVGDEVVLRETFGSLQEEFQSAGAGSWLAQVTAMDGRRVDKAMLRPITPEEADR
ncbi:MULTISPECIES: hemolysin family protein [Corynebacterium]|uniref:Hemolysin family protein n=1 Tax=Corynebacterium coyleae TaxID=53374 RepID=A0AAP6XLA0_9CORY|nr:MULTISPECIES: hemolysin family protein [Corynebacterium]MDK8663128.1 hemolysin family protein [Corynebacterium coyleae]MDK8705826.1 hemolysin family protein [Corynebacterium coyleae]MDK8733087.1 hemolysin family protein [Corynebacterium coyleae]MDK8799165.1 hemolysin family protein [Corynebacterium coyleae]MDK8823161.1 hemolysin family protein [Corynebacterium coyleae]